MRRIQGTPDSGISHATRRRSVNLVIKEFLPDCCPLCNESLLTFSCHNLNVIGRHYIQRIKHLAWLSALECPSSCASCGYGRGCRQRLVSSWSPRCPSAAGCGDCCSSGVVIDHKLRSIDVHLCGTFRPLHRIVIVLLPIEESHRLILAEALSDLRKLLL